MPHGGGHVGGHHGGGFSGGGGGFHHHHHHHRNYGGVVYTGGPYWYGGRYRYRGGCIWVGVGVFICVVVVLSVTLSIRFSAESSDENNFTPGDTRIVSSDKFFCRSISVSSSNIPSNVEASVYHLTGDMPSLTERNHFSFNHTFSLHSNDYEYWHFYLYPRSNITYSGCIDSSSADRYTFYIIKGTSKFNSWKDDPSTSKAVGYKYISQTCNEGKTSLSFSVRDEGHYYLVYYNSDYFTISGQHTLSMERFEYAAPNTTACILTGGLPCTISFGFMSSFNKVLVSLNIPFNNIDWDTATYAVDISCGPAAEGYVIVTVVPVISLVLCIVMLVAVGCCIHQMKKKTYQPLNEPAKLDTAFPPVYSEQPPPYNPTYK